MDEISFEANFYAEFLNGIDDNINNIFINFIKKISTTNNIQNNKIIIDYYSGDVHNAIEIYKLKNNNTFEYDNKQDFYAKLAMISLYTKFHYLTKKKLIFL